MYLAENIRQQEEETFQDVQPTNGRHHETNSKKVSKSDQPDTSNIRSCLRAKCNALPFVLYCNTTVPKSATATKTSLCHVAHCNNRLLLADDIVIPLVHPLPSTITPNAPMSMSSSVVSSPPLIRIPEPFSPQLFSQHLPRSWRSRFPAQPAAVVVKASCRVRASTVPSALRELYDCVS